MPVSGNPFNFWRELFSLYVCGVACVLLPDLFGTRDSGVQLLKRLARVLRSGRIKKGRLPSWCLRTLEYELLPEVEIRTNRFLAEAYQERDDPDEARMALTRITEIASPDSEHSGWARLEMSKLKRTKTLP